MAYCGNLAISKGQDYKQIIVESVESCWVPELSAVVPECPVGFMWVAVRCYGGDSGFLQSDDEQGIGGACGMDLCDVPGSLPVLESGDFVPPLPDQINSLVYEYQEVQVLNYADVLAGHSGDFVLNQCDFPILTGNHVAVWEETACDFDNLEKNEYDVSVRSCPSVVTDVVTIRKPAQSACFCCIPPN